MALQCYQHPKEPAAAVCASCQKSLCALCAVFDGFDRCRECDVKFQGRRRIKRVVLVGVLAIAVVSIAVYVQHQRLGQLNSASSAEEKFNYGKYANAINDYRAALAKAPCDRSVIVNYGEKLLAAKDHRGAISTVDTFLQKCGKYDRLLWVKFSAFKALGEFDSAVSVVTILTDRYPGDSDYWWWRAEVMEQKGDLEQAAADYLQAILVTPRIRNIPINLANVYDELGRPCDAIAVLEDYTLTYPHLAENVGFQARLDRLRKKKSCDAYQGDGRAVVKYNPLRQSYEAVVRVNGVQGNFIVDTGASAVTVSKDFAERSKLAVEEKSVRVQTANGQTNMQLAVANEISMQGTSAKLVRSLVADKFEPGVDGLLGLTYLQRFRVAMNEKTKQIEVSAKK